MSDGEELVVEVSADESAAVAAAADANKLKRKRKDPPTQHTHTAPGQPNGQAASAAPARPPPHVSPSVSFDAHLLPLSASAQSSIQTDVLSLIFSGKTHHPPHLYRNLPGPQPISITRSYLPTIQSSDYWVCEKSDGERAMLFISNKTKGAYLIDRKFFVRQIRDQPVYVELYATQGDTLLDGELVLAAGPVAAGQPLATFMTFDVLTVNGQRTQEQKLSQRLAAIGNQVIRPYRSKFPPQVAPRPPAAAPTTFAEMMAAESAGSTSEPAAHPLQQSLPPLNIGAKAFHRKHHIKDGIFDFIKPLGHDEYEYNDGKRKNKNDGIIFTPEDDDYWCKRVPLLKWKWNGLNTIDFLTRSPWFDHEGKLMLYSTANSLAEPNEKRGHRDQTVTVHVRSTLLTETKKQFFLRSIAEQERKTNNSRLETAIAEMQYDPQSSSWQPKNFRWDKSSPNFMSTVVATMETIIDNVTPEDLQRVCAKRGVPPPPSARIPPHSQQYQVTPPPTVTVTTPLTRTVAEMSPFDAIAMQVPAQTGEYVSPFG